MHEFIAFREALALTLSSVPHTAVEVVQLLKLNGRVAAEDIPARVSSPSVDVSRKDGYAVLSKDTASATQQNFLRLRLLPSGTPCQELRSGQAVRLTTGAPIPPGADAVIAEEFCTQQGNVLICTEKVEPGRNILPEGTDIKKGCVVAQRGQELSPPWLGFLASAGITAVPVFKLPSVAVIATGDEVVAPGKSLSGGKIFASNLVQICSYLSSFGMEVRAEVVPDREEEIRAAITTHLPFVDAFLTSGGLWGSERDLMPQVLADLGWQQVYRRVRMGPGKGVAFGLLQGKPFFCLPGGPPSNEVAFLQLALPGLLAMCGRKSPVFPSVRLPLACEVSGTCHWTQFIHAGVVTEEDRVLVEPLREPSRLRSMAQKEAFIILHEGIEKACGGELVEVQVLRSPAPLQASSKSPHDP